VATAQTPRAEPAASTDQARLRIMFVCSSGGHLLQLYRLKPWWEHHDRTWVTFEMPDSRSLLAGERVAFGHHPTTRNLPNMVRNYFLARRLVKRYRPDLIVSSGAGVAVPFFVVGRMHRVRTVYIEVYDRIDLPTVTGKLCYPLSSLFLLQWEQQRRFYPRGQVIGRLL